MKNYDPQKNNRRSIRLKGYDYTLPGAYFITLGAYQRANIFGEIVDGKMRLSILGGIVHEEWMRSNNIRDEIRLYEDEFIVMPNHLHGIVWIIDITKDECAQRTAQQAKLQSDRNRVGADGIRPIDTDGPEDEGIGGMGARRAPQQQAPIRALRSLSSFVAGFKSVVTRRARDELAMRDIWQRNYHDHIIRNEREFTKIWVYINNNPENWEKDRLNSTSR